MMGSEPFPFHTADALFTDDGELRAEAVERLHRWQAPAFALAAATAASPGRSIGIPTWLYGHEPPTPLAALHAKYFENSIREDGLLTVATGGVVFAPGKAGTLQEIFQDAAQNYYARGDERFNPMVFLDVDEYWTVEFNVRTVLERLLDEAQETNLHWVATADAAVAALVAGRR
jgi:predicted Rossmann-fold nucleotide-binding protein